MADSDTTTIRLDNDVRVNGRLFKAGQKVVVPKDQADDISRMDFEHNQYKDGLNKKREFIQDAGTMAVGSGQ